MDEERGAADDGCVPRWPFERSKVRAYLEDRSAGLEEGVRNVGRTPRDEIMREPIMYHCECGEYFQSKEVYDFHICGFREHKSHLHQRLEHLAIQDAAAVNLKNIQYGESWCRRGGQQAFAVIWRKADRIESILQQMNNGFDIFEAWRKNPGDVIDDIRDLRRYLLLLEEYMTRPEVENQGTPPQVVQRG